jgi:hypothetical protein
MRLSGTYVSLALGIGCLFWISLAHAQTAEDLSRRAKVIKPGPEELKWRRIPWVLDDLAEAQRLALQEKRPIFLWASGDEPLERC